MSAEYFVMNDGVREGPLDLLTIMRRVRAGKITASTEIYIGNSEFPERADQIDEINPFFVRLLEGPANARATPKKANLMELLRTGWLFTVEHNILTVYAGGMLLLVLMLTLALVSHAGITAGLFISWLFFMILHNLYFVFALRFFRGQTFGEDFINLQLAPALLPIFLSTLIFASLIAAGIFMLIVPGVLAAAFFIFVPLILLDKHISVPAAFKASFAMVRKAGMHHILILCILLALHLLCFAFIMPVPLTLPIFVAALCDMYEKLST